MAFSNVQGLCAGVWPAAQQGPVQSGHCHVPLQPRHVWQGQRPVDKVCHQVPAGCLCLLCGHTRLFPRRGTPQPSMALAPYLQCCAHFVFFSDLELNFLQPIMYVVLVVILINAKRCALASHCALCGRCTYCAEHSVRRRCAWCSVIAIRRPLTTLLLHSLSLSTVVRCWRRVRTFSTRPSCRYCSA